MTLSSGVAATQWADTLINAGATLIASLIAVVVAIWLSHVERKSARAERLSDEAANRLQHAEVRRREVAWALKLQALTALDRAIEEVLELERATRHNDQQNMNFSMSTLTNASALISQFEVGVGRAIHDIADKYPKTHSLQDTWRWASESEVQLRAMYSSTLFAWYSQEASSGDEAERHPGQVSQP